eukprot:1439346-Alexandrium_andersonii.AAC.1
MSAAAKPLSVRCTAIMQGVQGSSEGCARRARKPLMGESCGKGAAPPLGGASFALEAGAPARTHLSGRGLGFSSHTKR